MQNPFVLSRSLILSFYREQLSRVSIYDLKAQEKVSLESIYLFQRKVGQKGSVKTGLHPTVPGAHASVATGIFILGYNQRFEDGKVLSPSLGIGETPVQSMQNLLKTLLSDPRRLLKMGESKTFQNACFVTILGTEKEDNVPVQVQTIREDINLHPYFNGIGVLPQM